MSSTDSQTRPTPPFPEQATGSLPGQENKMDPAPEFEGENYLPAGKLKDKVAIITGGDSGIGRSVAVLFAREGAKVTFSYLPEEKQDAEETRQAIESVGGESLAVALDVTDCASCENLVSACIEKFGQVDILINNAAFQNHVSETESLSFEQWDKTFQTNIYGYFRMVKATLPKLKAGSTIINTGSITGLEGSSGLLDYSSTKGAIHAFTKTLAQELVKKKIRVNCVAPGPVWTPLNPAERTEDEVKHFGEGTPYGRPAQPDEIAPTYVYLASNADSGYLTGQVIALLGGATRAG
ncbi:SDR family oxidoreductase [Alteromonas pelagimontana]|uniref:SDR family oxidoreductase n=1 Tax=Alteromonas pelagimontana TaxID=1858656 RepID=A0A6M4MGA9_9ALTE|nr:SDR family oxidoreductase [Alteromonas pelagimontana]QJR81645.1 SDR family oxidoreductase [Alteromonas pelagimontana]